MADTMQFDLVSPERKLASGQASAVRIPGADGDLTAMPDHAPVVTTLPLAVHAKIRSLYTNEDDFALTFEFITEAAGNSTATLPAKLEMTAFFRPEFAVA